MRLYFTSFYFITLSFLLFQPAASAVYMGSGKAISRLPAASQLPASKTKCYKYFESNLLSEILFPELTTADLDGPASSFKIPKAELDELAQSKAQDVFEVLRRLLEDPYENSAHISTLIQSHIQKSLQASQLLLSTPLNSFELSQNLEQKIQLAIKSIKSLTQNHSKLSRFFTLPKFIPQSKDTSLNNETAALYLLKFLEESDSIKTEIHKKESLSNKMQLKSKYIAEILFTQIEFLNKLMTLVQNNDPSRKKENTFVVQILSGKANTLRNHRTLHEALQSGLRTTTQNLLQSQQHIETLETQVAAVRISFPIEFVAAQRKLDDENKKTAEDLAKVQEQERQQLLESENQKKAQAALQFQKNADTQFLKDFFESKKEHVSGELQHIMRSFAKNQSPHEHTNSFSRLNDYINRQILSKKYADKDEIVYILFLLPLRTGSWIATPSSEWETVIKAYGNRKLDMDSYVHREMSVAFYFVSQIAVPLDFSYANYFRLQLQNIVENSLENDKWKNKGVLLYSQYLDFSYKFIETVISDSLGTQHVQREKEKILKQETYSILMQEWRLFVETQKKTMINYKVKRLLLMIEGLSPSQQLSTMIQFSENNPTIELNEFDLVSILEKLPFGSHTVYELNNLNLYPTSKLLSHYSLKPLLYTDYKFSAIEFAFWAVSRLSSILKTKTQKKITQAVVLLIEAYPYWSAQNLEAMTLLLRHILLEPLGRAVKAERLRLKELADRNQEKQILIEKLKNEMLSKYQAEVSAEISDIYQLPIRDEPRFKLIYKLYKEHFKFSLADIIFIISNYPKGLATEIDFPMDILLARYHFSKKDLEVTQKDASLFMILLVDFINIKIDKDTLNYLRLQLNEIFDSSPLHSTLTQTSSSFKTQIYHLIDLVIAQPRPRELDAIKKAAIEGVARQNEDQSYYMNAYLENTPQESPSRSVLELINYLKLGTTSDVKLLFFNKFLSTLDKSNTTLNLTEFILIIKSLDISREITSDNKLKYQRSSALIDKLITIKNPTGYRAFDVNEYSAKIQSEIDMYIIELFTRLAVQPSKEIYFECLQFILRSADQTVHPPFFSSLLKELYMYLPLIKQETQN